MRRRPWSQLGRSRTTCFARHPYRRSASPCPPSKAQSTSTTTNCASPATRRTPRRSKENVHRGIHEQRPVLRSVPRSGAASTWRPAARSRDWSSASNACSRPKSAELCLRCHEQNACAPGAQWRTSKHAHNGVTCTNCHTATTTSRRERRPRPSRKSRQPATGRRVRLTSYQEAGEPAVAARHLEQPGRRGAGHLLPLPRRHGRLAQIAGPHQICGPNGFNCTTCHDPHGKILESLAQGLCLKCHQQIADDGLAFLDAQPERRGLHRLPQPAPARQRPAVPGQQGSASRIPRSPGPNAERCRSRSRKPATSAIRRSMP